MANKLLFKSKTSVPEANTVNNAGGVAYEFKPRQKLAQIACTNCFNGTYYSSEEQLLKLAQDAIVALKNDGEYLAKVCLYSREVARMKDMPAFLMVYLYQYSPELFKLIFNRVIDTGKMLGNFVQIARSGQAGKKLNLSNSLLRNAIRGWFYNKTGQQIFYSSVGINPSMKDILRLSRVAPKDEEMDSLFNYFTQTDLDQEKIKYLPQVVQEYLKYKETKDGPVPNVDFRLLDSLGLDDRGWTEIAKKASFTTCRMNINTFARHGVFKDKTAIKIISDKLKNPVEVKKSGVYPYQLLTTWKNIGQDTPNEIKNAIQDAMELSIENVPLIEGSVVLAVDVSGSMGSPITGSRIGATTATRCVDVAGLFASSILRRNPNSKVFPFDTRIHHCNLNPRDTVLTNAEILARFGGGGTNCSLVAKYLNDTKTKADVLIYISDNESWVDNYGRGTGLMNEWQSFVKHNKNAKLVCIDLTPRDSSQVVERPNILQVGGFGDAVFDVISSFVKHGSDKNHWIKVINDVKI